MSSPIARISRPVPWRHEFIRSHEYRCHYCNRFAGSVDAGPDGKPWHVDHMNALAAGGGDVEENLTLACERCNSLKGVLPYENFRRYARQMFWVGEPSRLDLQDLEHLEAAYLRTTGGSWMHREIADPGSDCTTQVVAVYTEEEDLEPSEVIGNFSVGGRRTGGLNNVTFAIQAHRLMPKLIAEIHILHAELDLARREQQDAPDAA
ncbi:HNH endonuclease signature motif containing protein [Streptomyces sp. NPDC005349]|uniref:HNH endonuclease n=1 Tax=Streptomyces sp. NPDC005349 TaxID=3157037 RepID=UPI0033A0FBD1